MTTPLQFSFLFNTQNFIQAGSLHIPCFYILSRPVRSLYSVILQFPPACVLALSMQAQKGKTITQPAKTRYPSHRSLQHTPQYVSPFFGHPDCPLSLCFVQKRCLFSDLLVRSDPAGNRRCKVHATGVDIPICQTNQFSLVSSNLNFKLCLFFFSPPVSFLRSGKA